MGTNTPQLSCIGVCAPGERIRVEYSPPGDAPDLVLSLSHSEALLLAQELLDKVSTALRDKGAL